MADARPDPLTEPTFEAILVECLPGSDPDPEVRRQEMQARALEALRAALEETVGAAAGAWTSEPLHASRPTLFLLAPAHAAAALSPGQAWDVSYRLAEKAGIADAEPSFALHLDAGDVPGMGDPGDGAPPVTAALAASAPPVFSKHDRDWSPRLVRAPEAWAVSPSPAGNGFPAGKSQGEGILVGHPDSGYQIHPELFNEPNGGNARVLVNRGKDFVDNDPSALDPKSGHGLGTASVLMSAFDSLPNGFVNGVAPKAQIIPYRVAEPHLLLPTPVLLPSGMARLAKAIFQAVDDGCNVISISLGWLQHRAVEEAVRHAFENDVIIAAAAGNVVRVFIVWPAAYPQTICCAGCTSHRRVWSSSSHGKRVDVTGPAENVWKAALDNGTPIVTNEASGTSFAAATVAGIAALWLAHWGRARLLARYQNQVRLTTVFRRLLTESCDPPPENAPAGEFGKGIVNAERLLQSPLPALEAMLASSAPLHDLAALSMSETAAVSGERTVASVFGDLPPETYATVIRGLLPSGGAMVGDPFAGVGKEIVFQTLSNRALREALLGAKPPVGAAAVSAPVEQAALMRDLLRAAPISDRLRKRSDL